MIIWVKDSFIHMFALSFVHSRCVFIFFFHIVFLIDLLIGIFCDFFVFILQIVPTCLGVAGGGFWAMFVIQQTNRLMQPLIYIYIFTYIYIWFVLTLYTRQCIYIYIYTDFIYIYNILPGFQRSYTKSSSINEPLSIAMLKKPMVFNMEIFGIPLYNCIMTSKNITHRDFSRKYDGYIIGL